MKTRQGNAFRSYWTAAQLFFFFFQKIVLIFFRKNNPLFSVNENA